MCQPIDLNRERYLRTEKIDDELVYGFLPVKINAALFSLQMLPEHDFCQRAPLPKLASKLFQSRVVRVVHGEGTTHPTLRVPPSLEGNG